MTHDYFTEVMQRKERAEEDLYFARLDRKLIEQLHQQKELLQQGTTRACLQTSLEAPSQGYEQR